MGLYIDFHAFLDCHFPNDLRCALQHRRRGFDSNDTQIELKIGKEMEGENRKAINASTAVISAR